MKLLYRNIPAQPITGIHLILPRTGVCLDPEHRQGASLLATQMLFRGAGGMDNSAFNARLERLGAAAGPALGGDHVSFRLTTLTENLDEALDLFLLALNDPAFDPEEFADMRGETVSGWRVDRQETKRLRALEVMYRALYRNQPSGYLPEGTLAGLESCTVEEARDQYRRLLGGAEPVVAVMSDLSADAVRVRVLERLRLPPGTPSELPYPWDTFTPDPPRGRRVIVVPDEGTQTDEMLLAGFSVAQSAPDWHLHRLISLLFGGDMNSRLFRVIRGDRGLSYGASCWYEASQGRVPRNLPAPFVLYTFPSIEHSAEAAPLLCELYEDLVSRGVTAAELQRGRESLINAHPFFRDTPQKLLQLEIDETLYGVRTETGEELRDKLNRVTEADLLRAIQGGHDPSRTLMVLLGDPARLIPVAESLPGVTAVEKVIYP
ncbi:MAG: insulinase family protein [Deltaproteobacteria bacterium]|nr:insulinase family protein [Deltaproteobacteria bacterium]